MRVPAGMLAILRTLFLVAVIAGIAYTLVRLWPEVSPALSTIHVGTLVWSTVFALGYQLAGLMGWRASLTELGVPTPVRSAARIYLVSQLGKYIPGSIWAALAMVRLGQEAGLPRVRIAYSFALSLAFSLLTGLTLGVPALVGRSGSYRFWAIGALVLLIPVLLWPRLLNRILDAGLRLMRRGRLEQPLSGRGIARIVCWYVAAWILGGMHILVLTVALGAPAGDAVFPSVAAFAVASTLGILFIIAPAGAGVRDVLMVLLLAGVLGVPAATAVALISRVTFILIDVAGAAGASLVWHYGHRGLGRPPAAVAGPAD